MKQSMFYPVWHLIVKSLCSQEIHRECDHRSSLFVNTFVCITVSHILPLSHICNSGNGSPLLRGETVNWGIFPPLISPPLKSAPCIPLRHNVFLLGSHRWTSLSLYILESIVIQYNHFISPTVWWLLPILPFIILCTHSLHTSIPLLFFKSTSLSLLPCSPLHTHLLSLLVSLLYK